MLPSETFGGLQKLRGSEKELPSFWRSQTCLMGGNKINGVRVRTWKHGGPQVREPHPHILNYAQHS